MQHLPWYAWLILIPLVGALFGARTLSRRSGETGRVIVYLLVALVLVLAFGLVYAFARH